MDVELMEFTGFDVAMKAAACRQTSSIPTVCSSKYLQNNVDWRHLSFLEHVNLSFEIKEISKECLAWLCMHDVVCSPGADYFRPEEVNIHPASGFVIPTAPHINAVMTCNLREFSEICASCRCSKAPKEVRDLVDLMAEVVTDEMHTDLSEHPALFKSLMKLLESRCVQLGYCPELVSCKKMPFLRELQEAYEMCNSDPVDDEVKVIFPQTSGYANKTTHADENLQINAQDSEILQKLDDIMDRMTVYDWAISNGYIPARKKEKMKDE